MLQIDPFNSSCSQKTTIPQNIKVKVLRKSISLDKVAILKLTLASAMFTTALKNIYYTLWMTAITVVDLSNHQKVTAPKVNPASGNVYDPSSR